MYDSEEEAWRDLEKRKERERFEDAFAEFMDRCKPEASPAVVRLAFEAGWLARR